MKKKIYLILLLAILIFPINVFAYGVTASPTNVSLETGGSKTITVTVSDLTARMDISSTNSGVASASAEHLDITTNGTGSATGSFTIKANGAGTATIKIDVVDATSFSDYSDYSNTITINVTVTNPTTKPTTTTQAQTTQRTTQAQTTQRTTQKTTQQQTQQTQAQQQETTTTETTTTGTTANPNDLNKNNVDDRVELSEVKVVGYDFDFDPTKKEQTIYVYSGVKALYISSKAYVDGSNISGNGIVDITNNDSFDLTISNGDLNSTYTFNIEYIDTSSEVVNTGDENEDTVSKKNYIIKLTFCIIIILIEALAFIEHDKVMKIFKK